MNDKIDRTGTSSNSDSLKNMDEQSGKPTDGSQAYLDTDNAAAQPTASKTGRDKKRPRVKKRK